MKIKGLAKAEKQKFCSNCEHMIYYDWYNCSNEIFKEIKNKDELELISPKGLLIDEYWGFLRIHDEDLHSKCPHFKAIDKQIK